ncbi:MAG: exodeoxyribonuclease VII large subunit [Thermodesulfobacteriota bacterium]
MMFTPASQRLQTVSELTRSLRGVLESAFSFVTVVGEISNLRCPHSGHFYFTLKDAEAQLKAVLFKPQQRYLACTPSDGMEVICRGRITLYEPRGEYQLVVDTLEPRGDGALRMALAQLRQRLAAEGLFAQDRKRPLPVLPERICLITSPQGAAVHDFLRMARQRCPNVPIEIIPSRVQGEGASQEIAAAIQLANQLARAEVIVLCRGGGSSEDLWAFNEEMTVRAIAASTIPVVSAVGHEIDITLADLAADLRAPTPTAAAEMVLPSREQLLEHLRLLSRRQSVAINRLLLEQRHAVQEHRRVLGDPTTLLDHFRLATDHALAGLIFAVSKRHHAHRLHLAGLTHRLSSHSPLTRLSLQAQKVAGLTRSLSLGIARVLERHRDRLHQHAGLLNAVSPLAVLARGYAIVQDAGGSVVVDSRQVQEGGEVAITLRRGRLHCEVKRSETGEAPSPGKEGEQISAGLPD